MQNEAPSTQKAKSLRGRTVSSDAEALAKSIDVEEEKSRIEPDETLIDSENIPDYCERSLGVFRKDNFIRSRCILVLHSWWFDNAVVVLILFNCAVLAQVDPLKDDEDGMNRVVDQFFEPAFSGIFMCEFILKIIAMGFVLDPNSYLQDNWNILDFLVCMLSLPSVFPFFGSSLSGFSAVRTIRVLRPLRSLTSIPGMRTLICTVFQAIPMFTNVLIITSFFFLLIGLLGLDLFMGKLRRRCFFLLPLGDSDGVAGRVFTYENITTQIGLPDYSAESIETYLEAEFGSPSDLWYIEGGILYVLLPEEEEKICATSKTSDWPGRLCDEESGFECLEYKNPDYGVTNFDNILYAFLAIFQCCTLEGWTVVMNYCQDATNGYTFIYFLALCFLGGFFILNLALAVVTEAYSTEN
eukprot:gene29951-37387_t